MISYQSWVFIRYLVNWVWIWGWRDLGSIVQFILFLVVQQIYFLVVFVYGFGWVLVGELGRVKVQELQFFYIFLFLVF